MPIHEISPVEGTAVSADSHSMELLTFQGCKHTLCARIAACMQNVYPTELAYGGFGVTDPTATPEKKVAEIFELGLYGEEAQLYMAKPFSTWSIRLGGDKIYTPALSTTDYRS